MPQPTQTQVHVDAILTNISVAYLQDLKNFIATKVFPIVPVEKQSDKYFTYTKADWFRDEARPRADGTQSAGSGYGLSTAGYTCDVYAFHKDVGAQARANQDAPINLDREAAQFVTQRLMLRQEIQWVTDYFTTGVWGTDKVGGTDFAVWSDYATSDPINDVEDAKRAVLVATGFEPNTLVLGYDVFRRLRHHPDIVDRFKYTNSQTITAEMLARLFEIDRLLVAKAIKNTGLEGETAAYSFTHGKDAALFHVADNPGLLTPSAGYVFAWKGVSAGLGANVGISKFYLPKEKADRVEGEAAWDNKVVAADLGYFWSGAVA